MIEKDHQFKCFNHSKSWCPLFGPLPDIQDSFPDSPEFQCVSIIEEARELWKVPNFFYLESKYPQNFLLTARTIFESYDSVDQHMLEKGKNIHFKHREAVDFVKAFHLGMYFDEELFDDVDMNNNYVEGKHDYLILAIFAIAEAWLCLEEVLVDGQGNEPRVLKQIQVAQLLVSEATEQYFTSASSELHEQAEKIQEGRERGQAGRRITKAERHKCWQHEAEKIWNKNDSLTNAAVGLKIVSRLNDLPSEADQKPVSANWISRNIKKPEKLTQ
jgi:hypothetical protein